jgi:hypothetical protein
MERWERSRSVTFLVSGPHPFLRHRRQEFCAKEVTTPRDPGFLVLRGGSHLRQGAH